MGTCGGDEVSFVCGMNADVLMGVGCTTFKNNVSNYPEKKYVATNIADYSNTKATQNLKRAIKFRKSQAT